MENWSKAVFPASPSCWCLIQAPEPAQPSPGTLLGHSLPSMAISPLWHLCSHLLGWLHSHSAQAAWEGSCLLPPQQQPRNGSSCRVERFGKQPWSRRGQRGWAGKHLKAAAGGASFVQTNFSEEWSAKALLNIWKLRLFTSEVYTLHRFGDFFLFFRNSKRHIFDIRLTTLPIFMALLQTTQTLEFHKCL